MVRILVAVLVLMLALGSGVSMAQDEIRYGYTYHQPSGNRVVEGAGSFPDVTQIEIALDSVPVWLAGVVHEGAPHWVAVDADGRASHLTPGSDPVVLETLPPGMPPMIRSDADSLWNISQPREASGLSHPIVLDEGLLFIVQSGDVNLLTEEHNSWLEIFAVRDARLVVNAEGHIAAYSDPTRARYVHGIMGDDLEASSLSLLEIVDDELQLVNKIELPGTAVFEGLSPIWADVDDDGTDDLITTISDNGLGAQVVIMKTNGEAIATGPAIGQSNRWRHQIAWAALGENGEMGLVEVLTPHIGGIVGFFELDGSDLKRTASIEGYTSHIIGSRNLDMAVVGDFNGDGQMEVALPSQDRTRIAGLQIRGEAFEEVWSLPLDGQLSTNLAAISLPDGSLALAAGTDSGRVYLWLAPGL